MKLTKFINSEDGANVQIVATSEVFSNFANELAESTARRVIAEMNTPDNPLSEKEVCKQIGKTRQTLAKYRREGKLRYHRIGREIYYFPSQLRIDIQNF
jgi:response regulator of citrate/malate metabolism